MQTLQQNLKTGFPAFSPKHKKQLTASSKILFSPPKEISNSTLSHLKLPLDHSKLTQTGFPKTPNSPIKSPGGKKVSKSPNQNSSFNVAKSSINTNEVKKSQLFKLKESAMKTVTEINIKKNNISSKYPKNKQFLGNSQEKKV